MSNRQTQINNLITLLRESGFRITPQRRAVMQILVDNKEHLDTDEIFNRVRKEYPKVGLATVYKTIAMLKGIGEITELKFNNQNRRYESSGSAPHSHLVCTKCNGIFDFNNDALGNITSDIMEETGFNISNYRLDFFGVCHDCQSGKNN
jgi:Fur family peroxide stress response transcriptional regulator